MEKEKKVQKKKKTSKDVNKKRIILIVGICVLIVAIFAIAQIILINIEYKKYEKYEDKMYKYGFNKLYDNSSAKTSEKVTKSEAIKMVIGTCLNTFDISNISKIPSEQYQNAIWVLYAQDASLINASQINKNNANEKIKYVDVIKYFSNAKKVLLNINLVNEPKKEISDLKKYNGFEQEAILDMLSNDILQEVSGSLNGNKKVFKGKVNEIVINYIEKYNILNTNIQVDEASKPSNAQDYAYISKDVEKHVYEKEYIKEKEEKFELPKQAYLDLKQNYTQIVYKIEKYYNTILNVDYQKTNKEALKSDLSQLTLKDLDDKTLEEYVEYIRKNNIKITGNAKVQDPIIYFDGLNYRVRTKLDFKIESSLVNDNLLYLDFETDKMTRYNQKEYSIYVDVPLGVTLTSNTYYLKNISLNELVKDDSIGVIN